MSYRTLEEKFLADFAGLEAERDRLLAEIGELRARLDVERGNMLLDAMVREAGRKAVFEEYTERYDIPKVEDREYVEWCTRLIRHNWDNVPKPPAGVSAQEFAGYFEEEFCAAFEAQYERERGEEVAR